MQQEKDLKHTSKSNPESYVVVFMRRRVIKKKKGFYVYLEQHTLLSIISTIVLSEN